MAAITNLQSGWISYGSHNLGLISRDTCLAIRSKPVTRQAGHAAQMLPVLLQLRIHSTSCSMNNFYSKWGRRRKAMGKVSMMLAILTSKQVLIN